MNNEKIIKISKIIKVLAIFLIFIVVVLKIFLYIDIQNMKKCVKTETKVTCYEDIMQYAKPESFKKLGKYYAKDENNAYYIESSGAIDWYYPEKIKRKNVIMFNDVDIKSFEPIGDSSYAKDNENVYYKDEILKGADARSAELIEYDYLKDKKYVYHGNKIVERANPEKFELFEKNNYAKDDKNIFYNDKIIEGVNIEKFKVIKERTYYSKDDKNVYYKGVKIIGAKPNSFIFLKKSYGYTTDGNNFYYDGKKINKIDIGTFESLEEPHSRYWKDKNNIYYKGKVIISDANRVKKFKKIKDSYDYFTDEVNIYYDGEILNKINAKYFRKIKNDYAIDNYHIYYRNKIIDEVNPEVLKKINIIQDYVLYDKNVYYKGEKIKNADSETFHIFNNSYYYAKDKNSIYCDGKKLENFISEDMKDSRGLYWRSDSNLYYKDNLVEGIDIKSLKFLERENYVSDSKHVYYKWMILKNSEPYKIYFYDVSGGYNYIRSNNNIYWEGDEMDDVDVETFKIFNDKYSEDSKRVYYKNKVIKGADPRTFRIDYDKNKYFYDINIEKAKDKNNFYEKGIIVDKKQI